MASVYDSTPVSFRWNSLRAIEANTFDDDPPIRMVLDCEMCEAREALFVLELLEAGGGKARHLTCQHCKRKFGEGMIHDSVSADGGED